MWRETKKNSVNSIDQRVVEGTGTMSKTGKKKTQNSNAFKYKLALWGVSAFLLFVLAEVLPNCVCFQYSCSVFRVLASLSLAVVVGVIMTFVIDLPTRLSDYEKSFIHTLSSNDYLKTLDEEKLTKLRNDVTEQLHEGNAPRMAKELIDMDQKICELLKAPYYSRYRHSVICERPDEDGFISKEHTIDYQLINPHGDVKDAKEYIQMSNLVKLDKSNSDACKQNVIEMLEFTCSIDDNATIDYKSKCKFEYKDIQKKDGYYNTEAILVGTSEDVQVNETTTTGIFIMFKNNVQVHMRYTIKVHKEDRCFTKRLQHPAKNFRLDYMSKDENVKLYGQMFGTEMKQSNMYIRSMSSNSKSLECFDMLLPQNGAMVVML